MDRTPRTSPGLFARLERRLKPLFGGAQVTSIDAAPTPLKRTREWTCDACGQLLRAHVFDDSARGRMYCPDTHPDR